LKSSGFARTTIQNVLNHSTALDFKENYTDMNSNFIKHYAPALNLGCLPGARDTQPNNTDIYGVYDFLVKDIKRDKKLMPGDAFDYNSTNADVLGWLITRISGMTVQDFIQKNIWSKLQTEHDAYIAVDRAYMAVATAGMNSTTRDAARFGEMILNDGKYNGKQVIPEKWLQEMTTISSKDEDKMRANPKYQHESWQAYKNMWWVLDADKGEFAAVGIHGQVIYINREQKVVAAYFSSQAKASAANNPMFRDKLVAVRQIASQL
jgi:CubicO group peptidase (beta-lactamase class C family)